MVDESEISRIELQVEHGLPEWRESESKHYQLEYVKSNKTILADFSELSSKELNKSLLEDVYKLAGDIQAEELYLAISLMNPDKDRIVRNLVVFGFEKTEAKKITSNAEVVVLKIEVNQEDDFVDLI